MDLASAEAEIRHVFGFTSITEASIGAAPPGNNIAQCATPMRHPHMSIIDIYLSGLLARRQNAWSQDGGNMRVIANRVNR